MKNSTEAAAVLSQYLSKYPNDKIAKRLQIELDRASGEASGKRLNNPEEAIKNQNVNAENLRKFDLKPNYPNPFNPYTTIQFTLEEEGFVILRIYNVRGQLVKELVHEKKSTGNHTIIWDAKDEFGRPVTSGIYVLSMKLGQHKLTRKLMLAR